MKICVCSAATENLKWQYDFTNKLKEAYCKKYGYDYVFEEIKSSPKEAYHYRKDMILRLMKKKYDWIMWMDVDAWFNKFDEPIENLIPKNSMKNMVIARDHFTYDHIKRWHESYINSGVILIKNVKSSEKLLELWKNPSMETKQWMKMHTKLNDQPFLCLRVLFDSAFEKKVSVLEPEEMNWFILFGDTTDKFILHAAGIKKITKQADFYTEMLRTAIREKMGSDFIFILQDKINRKDYTETIPETSQEDKNVTTKMLRPKIVNNRTRLQDIFIPQGFNFKPTLRPAPDYNKPFSEINWN